MRSKTSSGGSITPGSQSLISRSALPDQAAGEISAPPARKIICRYLRKTGLRCESPSIDQSPDALIHLCIHHFGRALELFQERRAQVQAERRG